MKINNQQLTGGEQWPNDLKLSDQAARKSENKTSDAERGDGSLQRMVRPLRSKSRKIWDKIDSFLWGGDHPDFTL